MVTIAVCHVLLANCLDFSHELERLFTLHSFIYQYFFYKLNHKKSPESCRLRALILRSSFRGPTKNYEIYEKQPGTTFCH